MPATTFSNMQLSNSRAVSSGIRSAFCYLSTETDSFGSEKRTGGDRKRNARSVACRRCYNWRKNRICGCGQKEETKTEKEIGLAQFLKPSYNPVFDSWMIIKSL